MPSLYPPFLPELPALAERHGKGKQGKVNFVLWPPWVNQCCSRLHYLAPVQVSGHHARMQPPRVPPTNLGINPARYCTSCSVSGWVSGIYTSCLVPERACRQYARPQPCLKSVLLGAKFLPDGQLAACRGRGGGI